MLFDRHCQIGAYKIHRGKQWRDEEQKGPPANSEHHEGHSMIWLTSLSVSLSSSKLSRGLHADEYLECLPATQAPRIYKLPCLLRNLNPGPTAQHLASLTIING
ncbi:hypothetical protein TNCV_550391 [Trichonephila clavipes]|nr:hypothetical protein TNCV_550391 [Trichonephila clavipes]